MCESVVDKDAARNGKYLSLILKTAERGRKYQTVVVTFEFCPVIMPLGMSVFLPKPFV
jgi:hypothetical protein